MVRSLRNAGVGGERENRDAPVEWSKLAHAHSEPCARKMDDEVASLGVVAADGDVVGGEGDDLA